MRRRRSSREGMAAEFNAADSKRWFNVARMAARSLSHGERVGVRGDGLSIGRNPSPGSPRAIRPLPTGEVALSMSRALKSNSQIWILIQTTLRAAHQAAGAGAW